MQDKLNVFTRNIKKPKKGKCWNVIRKSIINKFENKCYFCEGVFKNFQLQIDHVVPVVVGGEFLGEVNLKPICKPCHLGKTTTDKKIIFCFKKLGILWNITNFQYMSCFNYHDLIDLYKYHLNLINIGLKYKREKDE